MAFQETGAVQRALLRVLVHVIGTALALVALGVDRIRERRGGRSS